MLTLHYSLTGWRVGLRRGHRFKLRWVIFSALWQITCNLLYYSFFFIYIYKGPPLINGKKYTVMGGQACLSPLIWAFFCNLSMAIVFVFIGPLVVPSSLPFLLFLFYFILFYFILYYYFFMKFYHLVSCWIFYLPSFLAILFNLIIFFSIPFFNVSFYLILLFNIGLMINKFLYFLSSNKIQNYFKPVKFIT